MGGERNPAQRRESLYTVAEEDVRWMMGDISDEEWEDSKEALAELRTQIGQMQWFSTGPNSVAAGKRGDTWNELVFAPRDENHRKEIEDILSRLKIYPWDEVSENVQVLVVENKRDVALLRAGLVFDYLADQVDRKERERLLAEERIKQVRILREQTRRAAEERARETEARAEQTIRERVAEEKREAERAWHVKIDMDREEYRKMKQEERDQRVAALFAALPEVPREEFERPIVLRKDHYYRFGYPRTPTRHMGGRRAPGEYVSPEQEEALEVDVEYDQFIQDFDDGKITEESLEHDALAPRSIAGGSTAPTMTLFPKKYEWVKEIRKKGRLREKSSQRFISQEELEDAALRAKTGDEKSRALAIRELSLMHRGLILYLIREVRARHSAAQPDDLLQAALQGLVYAVDHYDPERENSEFKKYMMPCMEGYMRRVASPARFRVIRPPVNSPSDRKKVIEAEQALRAAHPERPVETEEMAQMLNSSGVIRGDLMSSYDAFIRKALSVYEEIGVETIDDDSVQLSDVDMRGEDLYVTPEQHEAVDQRGLQDVFEKTLLSLSPREERVVRMYHDVSEKGTFAPKLYEHLREEFKDLLPGVTSEDIKQRIRMLTALGSLKKPDVLAILSATDRKLAERYIELLDNEGDESLESVGQAFGVTRERIRQILAKAYRKMKHPARGRKLAEFAGYDYGSRGYR